MRGALLYRTSLCNHCFMHARLSILSSRGCPVRPALMFFAEVEKRREHTLAWIKMTGQHNVGGRIVHDMIPGHTWQKAALVLSKPGPDFWISCSVLVIFLQIPFVAVKGPKRTPCSFLQNVPQHIKTHLSSGLSYIAVLPTGGNPDETQQHRLDGHDNTACELTITVIIRLPREMHGNSFLLHPNSDQFSTAG